MFNLTAALVCAVSMAGCAGGAPRDARCERPFEPAASLDVRDPAARRHLRDDGRSAESLAVKYADAMDGVGNIGEHRQIMERCEAALVADIARVHQVAPEQVRLAVARQNDTPF